MANDPKVVETTQKWQDQAVNDKGYRDGVDYSLAIKNATSDAEIKQLQAERQNKVDDVYSGDDPYTGPATNKYTGTSTSGTNTAKKHYNSDWTPQTATSTSNAVYRGQQQKSAAEYQNWLTQQVGSGAMSERDANIAWAKAGGTVYYDDGTPAWHLSGKGYNESLNWGNIDGELEKYAKNGDWDAVDELLNQMKRKAAYEGQTFDAVPIWYDLNQRYNGISAGMSLEEMYAGANKAYGTPIPGNTVTQVPEMGVPGSVVGGGGSYTPGSMGDYLDQWLAAAQKQQTNAIDYATQQAIQDLVRTEQDAQAQFQQQRNQVDIDEARAKDNQALYAEARGDKGGIGQAQYNSIMNTAAQNRLAVSQAQTKLSTDTARQIADLRAQGEYEKADALLQLTQQYLSQLISLEQWSLEYGLSVEKFNASLAQWEAEYEMKVADLTGYYNGAPTLANQKYQDSMLASAGETLLSAGIMPSASQLAAMGIDASQAQSLMTAAQLKAAKGNGGGGGSNPSNGKTLTADKALEAVAENGTFTTKTLSDYETHYGEGAFYQYLKGMDADLAWRLGNLESITDNREARIDAALRDYYGRGYFNDAVYAYLLDYFKVL